MDDIKLGFYTPIVTGNPQSTPTAKTDTSGTDTKSFADVLSETLSKSSDVNFSKHAVKRAMEHNIDLNDESISRLNEGVRIAEEKKLEEPLILVGSTAFLVNIPNNTVITAVDSGNMKGNVFTNIDGTVII
jgi:flagellar operon protein